MAYTVKVFLDTRYPKKDGTHHIKLRFRAYNRPGEIGLEYSVLPKYWDKDKKVIKTNCKTIPNVRRANIRLQEKKMHALNVLSNLEDREELRHMTAKEMKAAILGSSGSQPSMATMLLSFGAEIVAELRQSDKVGNARVYQTMLSSISMFLKDTDIPIQKLSYKWLK